MDTNYKLTLFLGDLKKTEELYEAMNHYLFMVKNNYDSFTKYTHYFDPSHFNYKDVFIEIPECEITTTLENKELLNNLKKFGFNNYCLLSDFTEKNDVYVDEIIHKANFSLNKEGVEAASATAIMCFSGCNRGHKDYEVIKVDQPFAFMVTVGGEQLFTGFKII